MSVLIDNTEILKSITSSLDSRHPQYEVAPLLMILTQLDRVPDLDINRLVGIFLFSLRPCRSKFALSRPKFRVLEHRALISVCVLIITFPTFLQIDAENVANVT